MLDEQKLAEQKHKIEEQKQTLQYWIYEDRKLEKEKFKGWIHFDNEHEDENLEDKMFEEQMLEEQNIYDKMYEEYKNEENSIRSETKNSEITKTNISKISQYQNDVLQMLEDNKKSILFEINDEKKKKKWNELQMKIEEHTTGFNEISIFNSSMKIFHLLIGNNEISAKDYLKQKDWKLSENELTSLNSLGPYKLEAIIIHVLGSLFNCLKDTPKVRLSTFIDQLDSNVRVHAGIKKEEYKDAVKSSSNKGKVTRRDYDIGIGLLYFLLERKWILVKDEKDEVVTQTVTKSN